MKTLALELERKLRSAAQGSADVGESFSAEPPNKEKLGAALRIIQEEIDAASAMCEVLQKTMALPTHPHR